MANFARLQLLKYGWEEGKGLGKNENGITEPVKLASNQNKTGIGYDENKPWWKSLYDDTVKNIKVKSHGDEISLITVNNMDAPKTEHCNFWKKSEGPSPNVLKSFEESEKLFSQTCVHVVSHKLSGVWHNKTVHEPTECNFTLNGKLERIAEQDALYLNTNPLLSAVQVNQEDDMAYRNAELDMEKSQQEIKNASILQCLEDTKDFVLSKSTKKRRKKKLDKLVQQLSTCSLEENNNQKQNIPGRKLSQKMKKNKEEKKNLKKLSNLHNSITSSGASKTVTECLFFQRKERAKLLDQIWLEKVGRKPIGQTSDILPDMKLLKCEKEEDSTEHKVDQSPEMRNIVVDNKAEKSGWRITLSVPWKLDKEIEYLNSKAILPSKTGRIFKDTSKDNYHSQRLYNNIQKKKNQHSSKEIKKIAEKLRGEALTNELNSVIKNLTTFGIAEKVNANTVKKKLRIPTQTHLTPV